MSRIGIYRRNLLDKKIGQFSVEFMFGRDVTH